MHNKLTDSAVQKHLNTPGILRDSILTGFDKRVCTSGKASNIIEPTVQGSTQRKVIREFPLLPVQAARELAMEKIRELSAPTAAVCYSPTTFPTLLEAYESYVTNIVLKPGSLHESNRVFRSYLERPHNLPIVQITAEMIAPLHLENCKRSVAP